jgi:hypothetical protein
MRGPLSTGPAVVLTGPWLAVARQAVHNAIIARRRNGLPVSGDYAALADALAAAMSRPRQCDTDTQAPQAVSEPDEMTVEEAMTVLGKSRRSVQRMAPRLGGRMIGGRWILDRRAVEEHRAGSRG